MKGKEKLTWKITPSSFRSLLLSILHQATVDIFHKRLIIHNILCSNPTQAEMSPSCTVQAGLWVTKKKRGSGLSTLNASPEHLLQKNYLNPDNPRNSEGLSNLPNNIQSRGKKETKPKNHTSESPSPFPGIQHACTWFTLN